jgi:hypothetical protein
MKVRIPGWARNEPVPSDLYRFADSSTERASVKVNGEPVGMMLDKGYVTIRRLWKRGDLIDVVLPMPVRRVVANDLVEADRGRVALQRGPIMFAAEWPDNPNGKVRNIVLPADATLTSEFRPDLLNGVQVIKGRAFGLSETADGRVVKHEQDFVAIPYATWANRGRGQMIVWLAATDAVARPTPYPTVATTSSVTASQARRSVRAINDGEEPRSSDDPVSYFEWWPHKGTAEWVEMAFDKPSRISEVQVYWFDDTGRGEVRVPASWRVFYRDGENWKPVETTDVFGVQKDRYNRLTFKPLTTGALRFEVRAQAQFSAGVQEIKVK